MLRLRMLGGLSVEVDAEPSTGAAAQRRRLALLALLASAGTRGLSRDKILAFLWPETEPEKARHALTNALYALRRDLREDALFIETTEVQLNSQIIQSDVSEFEAALGAGEHERAALLYAGPFLDGFHLNDAPEFERFLDDERARLSDLARRSMESIAVAATKRGDHRKAVEWWRRIAAIDALSSTTALGLMRALVALGDRAGALQYARIHELRLRDELDAAPEPAVAELAARLRARGADAEPEVVATRAQAAALTPSAMGSDATVMNARVPQRRMRLVATAAVVLLATWALARARGTTAPPAASANPAIVVLPFVDLSPARDQQYLGDGIAEELMNALVQVPGLRVVAQTSAFALRDAKLDVREIGKRLGVTAVLEGSVRSSGTRHRITVQLIDVETGFHRWSKVFERDASDVFAVQDEITRAVIAALPVRSAGTDPARSTRGSTSDVEAYALYLRGRYFAAKRTEDGITTAIRYFKESIGRDSNFARAYAGLANAYMLLASGYRPPAMLHDQARESALRALALDSASGEAYTVLGAIRRVEFDWRGAETLFVRAIAIAPAHPTAHHWYGNMLGAVGRSSEGVKELTIAQQLDPLSLITANALAVQLFIAGRDSAAFARWRSVLEMDPQFMPALRRIGIAYLARGRVSEAVALFEKTVRAPAAGTRESSLLARAYAAAGRRADARRVLRELVANAEQKYVSSYHLAAIYEALGEKERALDLLERAIDDSEPMLENIKDDAFFTSLNSDRRYQQLRARMGLPL